MDFFSITSGSSGNCICVGDSDYHVMIDAGISGKRIEDGMNRNGFKTSDMNGILITHEHIDHISGLGVLARSEALISIRSTFLMMQLILWHMSSRAERREWVC